MAAAYSMIKVKLLALEGFITDITERKLAEDKLMLYREIVTHSNDAIVITSPEGLYLEQNAANKTLIGFSDEELEGKTPAIVVGEEPFSALKAKLEEDGIFTGEMFVSAKDGTKVDIDVSAFTVNDETGKIANLVGIVRDITERDVKKSRSRWKGLSPSRCSPEALPTTLIIFSPL